MNANRWVVLVVVLLATAGISAALWSLGYKFGMLCCLVLPLQGMFFTRKTQDFNENNSRIG